MFDQIKRNKHKKTIWLAYQQGNIFEKFKENAKLIEMIKQFGYGKFTIKFKIKAVKLTNKDPKQESKKQQANFYLLSIQNPLLL